MIHTADSGSNLRFVVPSGWDDPSLTTLILVWLSFPFFGGWEELFGGILPSLRIPMVVEEGQVAFSTRRRWPHVDWQRSKLIDGDLSDDPTASSLVSSHHELDLLIHLNVTPEASLSRAVKTQQTMQNYPTAMLLQKRCNCTHEGWWRT